MKKILVTGGAGFIGSHLIERLVKLSDAEVYSLDNYSSGSELNHIAGAHYLKGDTKNINEVVDFAPQMVFHLGEYSRVEQSLNDLGPVLEANSLGTYKVFEFCLRHSCKIVYAGSSTKFGDGGLSRSHTPYGFTKAANTELIKCLGDWYGLPYAVTYFYNVFGGREITTGKYATVVGIFTECMRQGQPLTVVRPGTQQRNFTHINDVVDALILIGESAYGDDFGIGNNASYSIMELAQLFGGEIEEMPERRGNRLTSDVVTSKTKALGWECKVDLKNYIQQLRSRNWAVEK